MQHTCLLSVISITTIFPLNLIMRRGGHSTPEKGVEFHLLAYYSFRWQCMQLFPQSLRGPFLLLVIITLLLFAHEAEYSCRGPTKKMQHTKTLLCICVHIHFFFFWGNQGSIYLRLAEGTPTYSTWQGEEKHIGVKCIGNQWGIPPNTRAHFFLCQHQSFHRGLFVVAISRKCISHVIFFRMRGTIRTACLQHKNEPKHELCSLFK